MDFSKISGPGPVWSSDRTEPLGPGPVGSGSWIPGSDFDDFETFEAAKMPVTRIVVVVLLVLFLVIGVPLNLLILMTSIRFRKQSPSSSWEGFSHQIHII